MVVIVDTGLGNQKSVANMAKRLGVPARISATPEHIRHADRLILPGVGSFDAGMKRLNERGIVPPLEERVLGDGVPLLGICLGMQLLTRRSDEGTLPGLGWVQADTVAFRFAGNAAGPRLPHMGWDEVCPADSCEFFQPIEGESRFYFVHSYHVDCDNPEDVLATTHYGYDFVSAFRYRNIIGVQFHPEKSHVYGMAFMQSFCGVESS